jgi:hypothetical protein
MNEDRDKQPQKPYQGERYKPSRRHVNINSARGLSSSELITIIQLELLRARGQKPEAPEATLPTEVLHDIKFRLQYYSEEMGEISESRRQAYFRDRRDDDDRD